MPMGVRGESHRSTMLQLEWEQNLDTPMIHGSEYVQGGQQICLCHSCIIIYHTGDHSERCQGEKGDIVLSEVSVRGV